MPNVNAFVNSVAMLSAKEPTRYSGTGFNVASLVASEAVSIKSVRESSENIVEDEGKLALNRSREFSFSTTV